MAEPEKKPLPEKTPVSVKEVAHPEGTIGIILIHQQSLYMSN